MSTRARASAVFPLPIDQVWAALRDFTFPGQLLGSTIESCQMEEGKSGDTVGAVRTTTWKSGEKQSHRLLALSDLDYSTSWELLMSEQPSEVNAYIATLSCTRVTENNSTLVTWEIEFSADCTGDLISFHQKGLITNLAEMRTSLTA
eukprot:TRINITY_DN23714_c0_g1_i1.p2 TRINITY_DN23714_c0_g1~~TRINITY_DN23714_c0_g1_i1.p2  ORF type:complete len:156 (+),score=57.18 TRINITY_DN23714_c0_g1_i1:29-469(+)